MQASETGAGAAEGANASIRRAHAALRREGRLRVSGPAKHAGLLHSATYGEGGLSPRELAPLGHVRSGSGAMPGGLGKQGEPSFSAFVLVSAIRQ